MKTSSMCHWLYTCSQKNQLTCKRGNLTNQNHESQSSVRYGREGETPLADEAYHPHPQPPSNMNAETCFTMVITGCSSDAEALWQMEGGGAISGQRTRNAFYVSLSYGIELRESVNAGGNLLRVKMECLGKIRKIENCINDIVDFVDTWRNLSAQLEATRKMPRYTSLMLHSANWQSRLMARIELEIDIVASKLSEKWKQIEEVANMLNDFVAVDCQSQKTILSSCLREDLQNLLSYLMVEVMNWFEMQSKVTYPAVIASMKPNLKVEKAIAFCQQSLQAIANHTPKKSS
ncbi:hypothetical protein LOAG_16978 [Loa loa]|uniref:DHC_N1 domain-containing protein n=1 Tax=Loa loa TaxID=7209 RepID=A0A1I7VK62_LOALO|nr:hypothetical protein LOAG_16978 [Loa loa]EJD75980.1 hypothetical protein LOAG_16978 [Loa loa]